MLPRPFKPSGYYRFLLHSLMYGEASLSIRFFAFVLVVILPGIIGGSICQLCVTGSLVVIAATVEITMFFLEWSLFGLSFFFIYWKAGLLRFILQSKAELAFPPWLLFGYAGKQRFLIADVSGFYLGTRSSGWKRLKYLRVVQPPTKKHLKMSK